MSSDERSQSPIFTKNWFAWVAEGIWRRLLPQIRPQSVLEIGSFEGRSTCCLIELNDWTNALELHCVDTWKGGIEHQETDIDMAAVEQRFDVNTQISIARCRTRTKLVKHKGTSDVILPKLLSDGYANFFDFIYIDGSHQAKDVLFDAILAFKLAKVGGVIGFDDYTWAEQNLPTGRDLSRCPKMAIDAFTNIYFQQIRYLHTHCAQVYVKKVGE